MTTEMNIQNKIEDLINNAKDLSLQDIIFLNYGAEILKARRDLECQEVENGKIVSMHS